MDDYLKILFTFATMEHLHPLHTDLQKPQRFTYPFCYEPHPLCQLAAREVQTYIGSHVEIREDADRGKMFGVLVVEHQGSLAYLAAYSGLLAGRNDWDFFVPPVYDAQQPDASGKIIMPDQNCVRSIRCLQVGRVTVVRQSSCNMLINRGCILYVWRSSGGVLRQRPNCVSI